MEFRSPHSVDSTPCLKAQPQPSGSFLEEEIFISLLNSGEAIYRKGSCKTTEVFMRPNFDELASNIMESSYMLRDYCVHSGIFDFISYGKGLASDVVAGFP